MLWLCLLAPFSLTGEPVQQFTLDNGLRVFFLEKHSVPVVSVQVWYQTGSAQETGGIRGIAHLFEHMMFRGSENYESEEHTRLIHDIGGSSNAFTAEHVTVYLQTIPSEHLELVLKLEADRMNGLKLNQKILDTERQVVLEEFHHYLNNPLAMAFFEFRKRLYKKHPYHWTPLGELEDIKKLTVEDCQNFYESHYVPNNAALVVVGDIQSDKVLTLVEKHFGSIPHSDIKRIEYEQEQPQEEKHEFKLNLPIEVPVMALAFRIPPARHEDISPLEFLDQILASGRSSRLREVVVKDRKIAVEVGGQLVANKDPGLYACFAAYLPNRRASKVVAALLQEIERIKESGVTEDEVAAARNRLLSGKVFEMYSVGSIASEIGQAEFIEGDYKRFETVSQQIEAVTAEDVQRVAKTYFVESNMNLLSVRPNKFRFKYWFGGILYSLFK
ncbi:MAG: pitrilysin family protein [Planctomycetota bacterium]|nr:pitrilysin family protein [Planctomycetota bacterium]